MKNLYSFIIKPLFSRYDNVKKIDENELIINTSIENHRFVSKKAVVVSTPAAYDTKIKKDDIVYVHHNIFRRYYDIRGIEKNSSTFFKDDLYFCSPDQIYMYNLKPHLNYCFVKPILNKNRLENRKEQPNFGILKYGNSSLDAVGVRPGALVVFTPFSEFEFIIEGERLYCMKSNDIAVTHEHEGNEKENNPSWTESSGRVNQSS
tara:strand:- start:17040 stop:17654 length:615 start_codon:yes stop_codon:yes gene_type:complete